MHDDLVDQHPFGFGAVVAAIADHDLIGRQRDVAAALLLGEAVGRGEHPLGGNQRSTAEAMVVGRGFVKPHLVGILAVGRFLAVHDHLVVGVGGPGVADRAAQNAGG